MTDAPANRHVPATQGAQRIALPIAGMNCASCVARIEKAIRAVPGVAAARVNLAAERADVTFSGRPDLQAVIAAIARAGYRVGETTIETGVGGMTCASCAARLEKALTALPGVTAAAVNLATERATIHIVGGLTDEAALAAAIRAAGYQPRPIAPGGDAAGREAAARDREIGDLRRALIAALILALPVFALEMGSHLVPGFHQLVAGAIGMRTNWLIQFALSTLALLGPGRRFFRIGIPALLRGAPDMNALVALGTSAAWAYSVVATFAPGVLPAGAVNVYYEAAAVIVALVLLGRYLEAKAKGRTSQAIQRLIGLQPKTARVLRGGAAMDIPLAEVLAGDLAQIRPGERIPVDGEVVEGQSHVDEAMISGEPVPVAKSIGSAVIGGAINQNGALTVRATAVGADTVLAQIIRMVEQAQGAKLPIQALVDRVTLWFVPAVIALAALTFAIWLAFGPDPALAFALVNAVAVLIIACPCAMGLATPVSIMVATGRAAELGVLFRKGEALQTLRDVDVIAVDKTGTLTKGRPELTDLEPAAGFDRDTVLALVASVESRSEHPIAQALVAAAEARHVSVAPPTQFEAVVGYGASATVGGRLVQVGADRYMARLGHDVSIFAAQANALAAKGRSPLYAAIDGQLAAVIAVADPIKPTTPEAIRALRALGLEVAMITGDNQATADAVGAELGIDQVVGEVLPGGKVAVIERLRAGGRTVAFVGDGINDAPALAAADVGLAMGAGADVAIETADVVLMSGDLRGVVNALALSQAAIRNIRQNLFWAFGYNAALIPVAMGALFPFGGVLLSPVFAAGAMALSSVFVLTNALRLKAFRPAISP